MAWTDADGQRQSATGLLVRLGLQEYGKGGVLPHEKTHGGPKEDRYALLETTQINTSPLVFLAGSEPAETSAALLALTVREPDAAGTTGDGVDMLCFRWAWPSEEPTGRFQAFAFRIARNAWIDRQRRGGSATGWMDGVQ